jgi:hypothetical protein
VSHELTIGQPLIEHLLFLIGHFDLSRMGLTSSDFVKDLCADLPAGHVKEICQLR